MASFRAHISLGIASGILGAVGGFLARKKLWKILYIEKRGGMPRW